MKLTKRTSSIALLATSVAAVGFLTAGPSQGQSVLQGVRVIGDFRTPINQLPFTINESGSYVLTKCLTGTNGMSGITIDADDVTLDLNGFTLLGVAGSLDGITSDGPQSGVSVYNGTVKGWGGHGLNLGDVDEVRVRDISAGSNAGDGILIDDDALLTACRANLNGGAGISIGSGGLVRDCSASNNGDNGIEGEEATRAVTCHAKGNEQMGFFFWNDSAVDRCIAQSNDGDGFELYPRGLVNDCIAYGNSGDGFDIWYHSQLRNSLSSSNLGAGIGTHGGDSWIEGNTVAANLGFAIFLESPSTLTIGNQLVTGTINTSGNSIGPLQSASVATSPDANHP